MLAAGAAGSAGEHVCVCEACDRRVAGRVFCRLSHEPAAGMRLCSNSCERIADQPVKIPEQTKAGEE